MLAKTDEKVKKFLEMGEIKKVFFVPGKLINFVVGPER
jgi:leucyl-tRNA synthetase